MFQLTHNPPPPTQKIMKWLILVCDAGSGPFLVLFGRHMCGVHCGNQVFNKDITIVILPFTSAVFIVTTLQKTLSLLTSI